MKTSSFILLSLFAFSAMASLPYDFQGDWIIAGIWGFKDQPNYLCPRASFDVDGDENIQFYYEMIDKAQNKLLSNRSYYNYYSNGTTTGSLEDTFSPYAWTWDVLYYDADTGVSVLSQDDQARGLVLFRTFEQDYNLL